VHNNDDDAARGVRSADGNTCINQSDIRTRAGPFHVPRQPRCIASTAEDGGGAEGEGEVHASRREVATAVYGTEEVMASSLCPARSSRPLSGFNEDARSNSRENQTLI